MVFLLQYRYFFPFGYMIPLIPERKPQPPTFCLASLIFDERQSKVDVKSQCKISFLAYSWLFDVPFGVFEHKKLPYPKTNVRFYLLLNFDTNIAL